MIRRLFNVLAILSTVLWIAATTIWVRSRIRSDFVSITHHRQYEIYSDGAGIEFTSQRRLESLSSSEWPHGRERPDALNWHVKLALNVPTVPSRSGARSDLYYGFICGGVNSGTRKLAAIEDAVGTDATEYPAFDVFTVWYAPYWAVFTASGVLPVAWGIGGIWRRIIHGTRAGALCAECGYDMRATPERCPECGKVPKSGMVST